MKLEEIIEQMKSEETQEAFSEYLKMPSAIQKYLQPHADSRVAQAIATFKKNQGIDDYLPRLEAIEKGLEAKEAEILKTKLDNYLYKECNKKSVPYELLKDYPFADEKSIDEKIESYRREVENLRANAINDSMSKNAFVPSGSAPIKSRPTINGLSQKEIEDLEARGMLDSMIEHY